MTVVEGFPLRVGRKDAIALVNRGHDYTVHAARATLLDAQVVTACGRVLMFPLDLDAATHVGCTSCLRALRKATHAPTR